MCHGLRLWDRLRLRHIPQVPFAPRNFLVGHLSDFSAAPPYVSYERWGRRLGGIFLIFLGRVPTVVLRGKRGLWLAGAAAALQASCVASSWPRRRGHWEDRKWRVRRGG